MERMIVMVAVGAADRPDIQNLDGCQFSSKEALKAKLQKLEIDFSEIGLFTVTQFVQMQSEVMTDFANIDDYWMASVLIGTDGVAPKRTFFLMAATKHDKKVSEALFSLQDKSFGEVQELTHELNSLGMQDCIEAYELNPASHLKIASYYVDDFVDACNDQEILSLDDWYMVCIEI